MRAKIAGWVISLSRASLPWSANTMSARAWRSIWPSGCSTPGPKCSRILHQAGVPGMTTCLAMWSASMTSAPRSASMAETVLLPEAMPPVSPTSSMSAAPSRYLPLTGRPCRRRVTPEPTAGRLLAGVLALQVLDDVLEGVVARLGLPGLAGVGRLGRLALLPLVLGLVAALVEAGL